MSVRRDADVMLMLTSSRKCLEGRQVGIFEFLNEDLAYDATMFFCRGKEIQ